MIEKIAVVDLETTGPKYNDGDRIIQIGIVLVDNGKVVETYETKINPGRPIPYNISQLTGIYFEDIKDAPYIEDVIDNVYQLIKDRYLIAHNALFDYYFLAHTFKEKIQKSFQPIGVLDTVTLAKIFFPQAPAFNLTALSQYLHLTHLKAHDALADALVTSDIFQKIVNKMMTLPEEVRQQLLPILIRLNPHYEQLLDVSFQLDDRVERFNECSDFLTTDLDDAQLIESCYQSFQRNHWVQLNLKEQFPSYQTQWSVARAFVRDHHEVIIGVHNQAELDYFKSFISSENYEVIYSPEDYFPMERFVIFQKKLMNYGLKNKQLIMVAATYVWLYETRTGQIQEIHHELDIRPLIEKYTEKLATPSHFYIEAIERGRKADIVLIKYKDMDMLQGKEFKHKICMILDSQQYYDDILKSQESSISFKESKDQLRRIYHQIAEAKSSNHQVSHLLGNIQKVENQYKQLEEELIQFLNHHFTKNNEAQESVRLYLTENFKDSLNMKRMRELLAESLTELSISLLLFNESVYFEESINCLKHFIKKEHKELDILRRLDNKSVIIEGERLFEQYLHSQLVIKPFILRQHPLIHFSQVIIWGADLKDELYNYYNERILSEYPVDHFFYSTQNVLSVWHVPLEYLKESTQFTRPLHQVIESQIEYLLDQPADAKGSQYLIIANHLNQAIDTTRMMQEDRQLSKEYIILGEGIDGSLNKMLSRTQNDCHSSILIVTVDIFLEEFINLPHHYRNVMMQSLPFKPLNCEEIQQPSQLLNIDNHSIFSQIAFIDMILTMYRIKKVTESLPDVDEYLLFDQRLFTASYSNDVLNYLKNSYKFNFNTDKSINSWYTN